MSRNPMPWHTPSTDLTFVDTDDLIQELAQRGIAAGICIVRKDGNMKSNCFNLALIANGNPAHMLWAANNLLEKTLVVAEDAGLPEDQIQSIMRQIDYDPETDPTRAENDEYVDNDLPPMDPDDTNPDKDQGEQ